MGPGLRFKSRIFKICFYLRKDTSRGYTCLSGHFSSLKVHSPLAGSVCVGGSVSRLALWSSNVRFPGAGRRNILCQLMVELLAPITG